MPILNMNKEVLFFLMCMQISDMLALSRYEYGYLVRNMNIWRWNWVSAYHRDFVAIGWWDNKSKKRKRKITMTQNVRDLVY